MRRSEGPAAIWGTHLPSPGLMWPKRSAGTQRRSARGNLLVFRARVVIVAAAVIVFLLLGASVASAASVSLSVSPSAPVIPRYASGMLADVVVTVDASGTSDAGTSLLFVFLQQNGAACAATQDAQRALPGVTDVQLDQLSVGSGPFDATGMIDWNVPGTYRLCSYLYADTSPNGGQASGPPDATATIVVNVSAAPTASGGGAHPPHCVVPRIVGKTLVAAKKALKAARCSLGKRKRAPAPKSMRGRVISQRPQAGKRLAAGAKVKVVVGR